MTNTFIDAKTDLVGESINASVCIIGAGAAGITLARELAPSVADVVLVESGGLSLDGPTQALYSGQNLGLKYHDLLSSRLRYFGGTTNHWGGYCRYNDPIDYRGRPKLDVPRWPFDETVLAPFITRAAAQLGLEFAYFDPATRLSKLGEDTDALIDDASTGLMTKIFQISSKTRFAKIYGNELARLHNLRTYLNLSVTDIQLSESGRNVTAVTARTLTGKTVKITANTFVLACHAIENARLLLASNSQSPTGIGNRYDHVGRYFMDHVHVSGTKMIPSSSFPSLYNFYYLQSLGVNANISFTDPALQEMGILQYYCRFLPVYADEGVKPAMRRLQGKLWEPFDPESLDDLAMVLSDLPGATRLARSAAGGAPKPQYFNLQHRIEQAPNPESRILLSAKRDALGNRQADLMWRLNDVDYRTFRLGQQKIVAELSALGLGRFMVEELHDDYIDEHAIGHYHHIGTTRMAARAEDGVVDPNCRVFNVDNLYVAGSSTFPTAGYSGPTMMIIALALRLADHLKQSKAGN